MSPALKNLTEQALQLSNDDKFILIDTLSHSVERPLTDIDKVWIEESIRRSEAYDRGEMTARDAFVAIKEISAKIIPQK